MISNYVSIWLCNITTISLINNTKLIKVINNVAHVDFIPLFALMKTDVKLQFAINNKPYWVVLQETIGKHTAYLLQSALDRNVAAVVLEEAKGRDLERINSKDMNCFKAQFMYEVILGRLFQNKQDSVKNILCSQN